MNAQDWQTANTRYLSIALEWLRLKLQQFIQANSARVAPATLAIPERVALPPATTATTSWKQLFTSRALESTLSTPALPSTESSDKNVDPSDEQLLQLEAEMQSAASVEAPPALVLLGRQLGLTGFEQNILLLCVAMEFDTRLADLCAQAQDNQNRVYPTFALALSLFDDPAWEALSPDRPLRYWRLIEISQPGAQPLTLSALRADERIVSYLKGLNRLDDRLMTFLAPMESVQTPHAQLSPSQEAAADAIIDHWEGTSAENSLPVVQLLGPDVISKQLVAARVAEALGRQVFRLDPESLPPQLGELESLARLWQRESLLLPLALYIDAQDLEAGTSEHTVSLKHFVSKADGPILVAMPESSPQWSRPHFQIEINKPTMAEQHTAWTEQLGQQAPGFASQLAAQFNFNETTIAQVAGEIANDPDLTEDQLVHKLWAQCRTITRPRLDGLAERLDPKATWDDLVLPAEQTMLLHQIVHQVRQRHTVYEDWGFAEKMNRGLGISALFAGESGTGKTMAAEVIANELQLDLYRIDLSAVVSKYIGETEKNLRRVFLEAEAGCWILFFDEADAIFGKRSEVKDSHDRYANIEINYLLQRMESYRGLAILATNRKSDMDPAFERRVSETVHFPHPEFNERKLIWQKVFPRRVPRDELDYDRLARFYNTGGDIQKAALIAAFTAAHLNSKVTMETILSAMRILYRKRGQPIFSEKEFRV